MPEYKHSKKRQVLSTDPKKLTIFGRPLFTISARDGRLCFSRDSETDLEMYIMWDRY